jgi:hypothetical protein
MLDREIWDRWKASANSTMAIPKIKRVWNKTKDIHTRDLLMSTDDGIIEIKLELLSEIYDTPLRRGNTNMIRLLGSSVSYSKTFRSFASALNPIFA